MRIYKPILWIFIFIFLISFVNAVNPSAYWSFDTDATEYFGNYDGVNNGATHVPSGCISGGCFDFELSTTDYISTAYMMDSSADFSISLMAFVESAPAASAIWGTFTAAAANGIQLYDYSGFPKWMTNPPTSLYTTPVHTNGWTHVVITYNQTNISMYINGTLRNTSAATVFTNSGVGITFGRPGDYDGQYYDGLIDEVSIYTSQLSDTDVLQLYNNNGVPTFVTEAPTFEYLMPYYCYQEFANVSPTCGGFDNGTYNFTGVWSNPYNTIDGDPSTFGTFTAGQDPGVNVNISWPPISVINKENTLWQIITNDSSLNQSLSNSCLDRSNSTLELSFESSSTNSKISVYCRNESNTLDNIYSTNVPNTKFFEEGIWWQFNNLSTNITINYSNIVIDNGENITKNLAFNISMACEDGINLSFGIYVNGTYQNEDIIIECNGSYKSVNGTYTHSTEGKYNFSFFLNGSTNPLNNKFLGNSTFTWDLTPPVINITFSATSSFEDKNITINLTCTDTITSIVKYNMIFNNATLIDAYYNNTESVSNLSEYIDGLNNITGVCSDYFNNASETILIESSTKILALINERENAAFDVTNISSVRVYLDDNSTFYDFQNKNNSVINFSTINNPKLRFELIYFNGDVITRYIDVSLIEEEEVRVCANVEGTTHFEQLILSATQKQARLKNLYSNCYVAADYIRFAYQDAFVLKGFTINSLYYLTTLDENGEFVILSSLDGSISAFINVDALEFKKTGFDLSIISDSLSTQKINDNEIRIFYTNLGETNLDLLFNITRLDTNQLVFTSSTFPNKDNFSMLFNYATLTNVTNSTLFRIDLTKTNAQGTTTIKRYFDTNAKLSTLSRNVAMTIAILLTIFGLTITVVRISFSWFGIFIMLASIIILSLTTTAWFVVFLQAIDFIILVYIIIIMTNKNYPTISG